MNIITNNLATTDPIIKNLIDQEALRTEEQINLIASENYCSRAVQEAQGSILTNKYAEGYPNKRYYAGCALVDQVENRAIERCKSLFSLQNNSRDTGSIDSSFHVNVQPHAGSQANMAAYYAVLNPGDTILGMSLAEGGHLTHGHKVNFSGKIYNSIQYTVNKETELLDYDQIEQLAQEHKPQLIIAGASAYSRTIDFKRFSEIARSVNAYLLTDIAHIAGLIATNLHPSPLGYADLITSTTHKTLRGPRGGLIMSTPALAEKVDKAIMPGSQGGPFMHTIAAKAVAFHEALQPSFTHYQQNTVTNAHVMAQAFTDLGYRIVTGGTDNHLFVIDLRSKNISGRAAQVALEKAGIIVSCSCIPFDPAKPWVTSGIRIGTPAITTRGMTKDHMQEIAELINDVIMHHDNTTQLAIYNNQVKKIGALYPVY